MTIALLAIASSGSIGDLKQRLNEHLTSLEEANTQLFLTAYTDPVTGLGNRRRLEEVINAALQEGRNGCLLVIELSGFRLYNALYGHVRSDGILLEVSKMLVNLSTGGIFVASFPGGQFGVWIPEADADRGKSVFDEFAALFHSEMELSSSLSLSAGLVVSDPSSSTFDRLMQNAAVALADTRKESGATCSFFSMEMAKTMASANSLKLAVRTGLSSNGFYPVYQTKVNSRTGQVCGVEGLARMAPLDAQQAPGPGEFIPVIHAEGWMTEFGALMLKAIMKDVPHLVEMYGPHTKVSINVSPPLFLAAEFLPMFRDSLSASNADPKNVVIEITEEVFASSLEEIITVTNEIRTIGADISLDDFGSGFSSLSYLRAVHFDEIKIDRSFVQILDRDPKGNILLSAITDLGLALGSRMVAEGVETQAQLETVQNAGCDIIQGYFYSKPIVLAELA
jgi:diguanylate cyclase (GGDEF)-like protein